MFKEIELNKLAVTDLTIHVTEKDGLFNGWVRTNTFDLTINNLTAENLDQQLISEMIRMRSENTTTKIEPVKEIPKVEAKKSDLVKAALAKVEQEKKAKTPVEVVTIEKEVETIEISIEEEIVEENEANEVSDAIKDIDMDKPIVLDVKVSTKITDEPEIIKKDLPTSGELDFNF